MYTTVQNQFGQEIDVCVLQTSGSTPIVVQHYSQTLVRNHATGLYVPE
ncbi:hypothetical protein [Emticicia fontis]